MKILRWCVLYMLCLIGFVQPILSSEVLRLNAGTEQDHFRRIPVHLTLDEQKRELTRQQKNDEIVRQSREKIDKWLQTDRLRPFTESSQLNFSTPRYDGDSAVGTETSSRADSQLDSSISRYGDSAISSRADNELRKEELLRDNDMQAILFEGMEAFDEELKAKRMDEIRAQGNGNIRVFQNGAINWFKIKFPFFSDTDLIKTYRILFAFANCDDTLPALVSMLNNCVVTSSVGSIKSHKESGRRVISRLIGDKAATLVEDSSVEWRDKLRIKLLEKYFYQMEYELEETAKDPFTLDELIRFRDEARAIEEIKKRPLTTTDKRILMGIAAAYGVGATYLIAPTVFNSGVDFVTQTLPNAFSLSNLSNLGSSALNSMWSATPSLPFSSFLSR